MTSPLEALAKKRKQPQMVSSAKRARMLMDEEAEEVSDSDVTPDEDGEEDDGDESDDEGGDSDIDRVSAQRKLIFNNLRVVACTCIVNGLLYSCSFWLTRQLTSLLMVTTKMRVTTTRDLLLFTAFRVVTQMRHLFLF